jgi:hypothetical protein
MKFSNRDKEYHKNREKWNFCTNKSREDQQKTTTSKKIRTVEENLKGWVIAVWWTLNTSIQEEQVEDLEIVLKLFVNAFCDIFIQGMSLFVLFHEPDGSENLAETLTAPPQNIWRGTDPGQFKLERIQVERANLYAHFYKEFIERRT